MNNFCDLLPGDKWRKRAIHSVPSNIKRHRGERSNGEQSMVAYYIFERVDEAKLTAADAKQDVKNANFDENLFTYAEDGKKVKVTPTGLASPYLPPSTVAHNTRPKINVTVID